VSASRPWLLRPRVSGPSVCRLLPFVLTTFHSGRLSSQVSWHILNSLASALSRCHHGLETVNEGGQILRYTGFQKHPNIIYHRDIKPGNSEHLAMTLSLILVGGS